MNLAENLFSVNKQTTAESSADSVAIRRAESARAMLDIEPSMTSSPNHTSRDSARNSGNMRHLK